jgi:2-haloacid dehalogenase
MSAVTYRVSTVVFDVGHVLVRWDLRCLFEKLIDDPEELDWFLAHVVTEEWHYLHDSGVDLAARITERKQQFPGHAGLIDAYATRYAETIPGPIDGMPELVGALAERNVPLFAITNFGAEFWDQFRPTEPMLDLFDDIIVSGVERIIKPDPAIFELAARRFDRKPGEMLFIDDNPANIASAEGLGWHVHHFSSAERLELHLRGRGLLG